MVWNNVMVSNIYITDINEYKAMCNGEGGRSSTQTVFYYVY